MTALQRAFALGAAVAAAVTPPHKGYVTREEGVINMCEPMPQTLVDEAQHLVQMQGPDVSKEAEVYISKHAVIFTTGGPMELGAEYAAHAYATLPRPAPGVEQRIFTKVAIVAAADSEGPVEGVSVGTDVCGEAGQEADPAVDKDAEKRLRKAILDDMRGIGPPLFSCKEPNVKKAGLCHERRSVPFKTQLPFIYNVLTGGGQSPRFAKNNIVPVLMQATSTNLGVSTGRALYELVRSSGIWETERVLFVFAGNLSHRLKSTKVVDSDEMTLDIMTRNGMDALMQHFGDLGDSKEGHIVRPASYATVLAAKTLATSLHLKDSRYRHSTTQKYWNSTYFDSDNLADGLGAALFWKDDRFIGLKGPAAITGLLGANSTKKQANLRARKQGKL